MSLRHIVGLSLLILAAAIFLVPFDKAQVATPPLVNLPPLDASGTPAQQTIVANMADTLILACPAISEYAADIDSITGSITETGIDGIDRPIAQIVVAIRTQPQYIPSGYRASGQHCVFDLPIDHGSDIYTSKQACEFLCGGQALVKL